MHIPDSILDENRTCLVRVLLADTTLPVKVGNELSGEVETTIGTSQGGCLFPKLLIL